MTSKKTAPYTISIKLGDTTLKGTGASVYEALSSITPPVKVVGKVFVEVKNGKRKAETMLMPVRAKRLFYPNAQPILAKQLDYLLQ